MTMLHVQHPDPSDPHWEVVGSLWGSSSKCILPSTGTVYVDKTITPFRSPLAHPRGHEVTLCACVNFLQNGDAQVQSEVVCDPFAGLFCAFVCLSTLHTVKMLFSMCTVFIVNTDCRWGVGSLFY